MYDNYIGTPMFEKSAFIMMKLLDVPVFRLILVFLVPPGMARGKYDVRLAPTAGTAIMSRSGTEYVIVQLTYT